MYLEQPIKRGKGRPPLDNGDDFLESIEHFQTEDDVVKELLERNTDRNYDSDNV